MHRSASFNFELVDPSQASIAARAAASMYGKGVFTTIAIFDGTPFVLEKHWRRLRENSESVGIDISEFTDDKVEDAFADLVDANGVRDGRARITFFDESASELWPYESKRKTSVLITTADFRPSTAAPRLTSSPYRINSSSPLSGVKSCNYLEKILAKSEAKQRGFEEAVQLNERGEVASAIMANIFWQRDGRLFTPSLDTGCLPGTTREFILENIGCEEVEAGIDEFKSADHIFLTSAGVGIIQASEFAGRELNRERHAITELLPQFAAE